MFGLGFTEILVILVLVLILFGAGKLPQVMGDLGRGLKSFKDEMDGGKGGKGNAKPAMKALPRKGSKPAPKKKTKSKPAAKKRKR